MIIQKTFNRKHNPAKRRVRMGVGLHDRDQGRFVDRLPEYRYLAPAKLRNGNGSKYDPNIEAAKHKAD
jgi:hypothetical protein